MMFKMPLAATLAIALFQVSPLAKAEGRKDEHKEVRENRSAPAPRPAPPAEARENRPAPPPRPAPPRFQPHPGGVHPHGPMVRPHPIRVLGPRVLKREEHPWRHWAHPEFARPFYYWNWAIIHNITCIAEDSYGDQYPVTVEAFPGFELGNMTPVEDQALDRCYEESGGDPSCYLLSCSHF